MSILLIKILSKIKKIQRKTVSFILHSIFQYNDNVCLFECFSRIFFILFFNDMKYCGKIESLHVIFQETVVMLKVKTYILGVCNGFICKTTSVDVNLSRRTAI